jgi:hypothetical protein
MAARLSLPPKTIVEAHNDSLLDTTAVQLSSSEPVQLLDLPTEVRFMIYPYLTHDLMIELPDLHLPFCTTNTGVVEKCFNPSIMLVCHQLRREYTAISMPAMILHILVACYGVHGTRARLRDAGAYCSVLPLRVLAQITRLTIDVRMGRGWPHGRMRSQVTASMLFSRR